MKGRDYMTETYTYDELFQAYDNFCVPAVAIYINNQEQNILTEKGITIDGMQVTLSTEEAAGLSFQVINAFDLTSHQIKQDIKDAFSVGTVIEAALGYGSNLTTVFKGYITEYRVSYQDAPVVSVTAVDFRKLLMQNKRKKYSYGEKTCSEIFNEIMDSYADLYTTLHVETVQKKENLTQNDSDYNFIKEVLCGRTGYEFFVVGSDVYFKPDDTNSAFLELVWGKNLVSFQRGTTYCNKEIKAYSVQKGKTRLEASETIWTGATDSLLKERVQIEEMELEVLVDNDTLENYVKKKASEEEKRLRTANGSSLGLPEIVPGRYIKISGVDSEDEGTYYIREVNHSFGSDGFTTSFSIGEKQDSFVSSGERRKMSLDGECKGVMRAVVKQNWNEEQPGKVLVEILTGEEGKTDTKWLPVVQPYCGEGYGFYFHPEIGTEVVLGSHMGDVNSLVVLGSVWSKEEELPEQTAGEKNTIKRISTKGKHEILFDDDEESGKIQISTAGKLQITLNEKEKRISLFDEEEKNGLLIDAENGTVHVKADKKIIFSIGTDEMLVLEKDSGSQKVNVKADKLEMKSNQSIQIQGGKLELKGTQAEIAADGSLKLSSSGMTEVKGNMVKIN